MPGTSCHEAGVVAQGSNQQKGNMHTSTLTLTVAGDVWVQATCGPSTLGTCIWSYTDLLTHALTNGPLILHSAFNPLYFHCHFIGLIWAWRLALHCIVGAKLRMVPLRTNHRGKRRTSIRCNDTAGSYPTHVIGVWRSRIPVRV